MGHQNIKSIYLHFPFCLNLCNYCDFHRNKLNDFCSILNYQEYLNRSLAAHSDLLKNYNASFGPLETLYLGGGTPSLWGASGAKFFEDFLNQLLGNKHFKESYEFTMEVNPRAWSDEDLVSWKGIGVNRFSIGIQTLNAKILEKIGRVHSLDDSYKILRYMDENDENFSVDFMIGLPFSGTYERDIISELDNVLNFNPSHISLYILTVGEDYCYYDDLPDEDFIKEEYLAVSSYLISKGFSHYEVSNFAKVNKESQHNLKYWKSSTVAAFGPSATGLLSLDNSAVRYKWNTEAPRLDLEMLNKEELQLEKLYMLIRTNTGVDPADFFTGSDLESFKELISGWIDRGIASGSSNKVYLNSKGFLLLDSLMDEIFLL